ncbi:hypothetical protein EVAR_88591_1 [Eumeta japonica]|uniref:Uncharacterized protein n=1 Tax=Eumeta variegata TaxID=151549 RepID=A0A4C1Y7X2_EUMVA|nr:hypothetical protein EVAR_88591_1 [Eumeta japonica]
MIATPSINFADHISRSPAKEAATETMRRASPCQDHARPCPESGAMARVTARVIYNRAMNTRARKYESSVA